MPEVLTREVRAVFTEFTSAPVEFWGTGPGPDFQVSKIDRALERIGDRDGLGRSEAADSVLERASARAGGHPPTIHVGGRGGSGSHWLAEMLHDLGPFADAGEVAIPAPLRRRMRDLSRPEQALLVDAIQLLHALPGREEAAECSVVNSRGHVYYLPFKQWEPGCLFVHLIRDPRDQIMSVTYRKPDARDLYPAEGGDEGFLRLMIYLNRASLLRTMWTPVPADFVARYEDLRRDPEDVLVGLAARAGAAVPRETAQQVAFQHRAENIQAGVSEGRGNLYTGARRGWRETTSARERQLLHAGLSDVIDITRYPLDDCMGMRLDPAPLERDLVAEVPDGVLLGELHARSPDASEWEPLCGAAGEVRLPAGSELRLRMPGGWTSGLAHLSALPAGALTALCLAGNQDVLDDDLAALRSQPALRELDLARTQISDAGLRHLEALPKLRALNLIGSQVSESGAAKFASAHPECTVAAGEIWSEAWREKRWLEDRFIP